VQVSSEVAAESDVPCSHRRCTTPSEPELSSGEAGGVLLRRLWTGNSLYGRSSSFIMSRCQGYISRRFMFQISLYVKSLEWDSDLCESEGTMQSVFLTQMGRRDH
jgi:hypothetical protein